MPKSRISNVENMRYHAIRENKILAKISEFTVLILLEIFFKQSPRQEATCGLSKVLRKLLFYGNNKSIIWIRK